MKRRIGAAGLSAALLGPTSAQASPQEVLGFGYRSTAMGTTGAASAEGVDAVYHNPALLSRSRDTTLEIGFTAANFLLDAEGSGLVGRLPGYSSFTATTIGGLLPLPFEGVLKDRITLGVGFVTPTDVVVRGRILFPEKPQVLLADRVQSVALQGALGVDVGAGFRIGGGVAALAALEGTVTVATDASGRIGTVVEDTLVASYAPLVGASYEWDDFRVGLAFRGELVGRFNVIINAENLAGLTIPPLNISGVAQYDPWQLAAEFAHDWGRLHWAVGLTYKHWPDYPGPIAPTVRCEDAANPEEGCMALQPTDPDYAPVVSPRTGFEYDTPLSPDVMARWRAGYAFEPTPAPEQRGLEGLYDMHRSVFSLGYGFDFDGALPMSLQGYGQAQWLHRRTHQKEVVQGAPVDGRVVTEGVIVAGGFSAGVKF
ncbi:MAG: hypothetical protein AAGA56_01200 [Myxococcota bacterium]